MPTCSVVGCPNGGRNGRKGVEKYKFPENEELIDMWKRCIGIADPDWKPKESSRVCGDHFCEVIVYSLIQHQSFLKARFKLQLDNNFSL